MWKEIGKACGLTPSARKAVLTLRDTEVGCRVMEEEMEEVEGEEALECIFPLSLHMPPSFPYLSAAEKEDPNYDGRAL